MIASLLSRVPSRIIETNSMRENKRTGACRRAHEGSGSPLFLLFQGEGVSGRIRDQEFAKGSDSVWLPRRYSSFWNSTAAGWSYSNCVGCACLAAPCSRIDPLWMRAPCSKDLAHNLIFFWEIPHIRV